MSWRDEASVVTREGKDYWRTWFLEECEQHQIFGLTKKHLPLVLSDGFGFRSYREGTKIYLDDAPYFNKTKTHHRVCGPYSVVPSTMPINSKIIHKINGKIIIYEEKQPQKGPWLDKSYVRRIAENGVKLKFKQIASEFGFFPYRFSIMKTEEYKVHFVKHDVGCWLCVR